MGSIEISNTAEVALHPGDKTGLRRPIKYRPDIDGLRAIAVTSVVAYHAGLGLRGGFVGVDVFFVISGYLIGSLVYKEIRGQRFSLARFYGRRVKRILPALFGLLLFCYGMAFLVLSPQEITIFAESALATVASSSNILFWLTTGNYFSVNVDRLPLLMTWTLGVEEQFYVFLPLLLLLLRRTPAKKQLWFIGSVAALSLAASVWATAHHPGLAFYLLPARCWELGAGVLLAMFEADHFRAEDALPPAVAHGLSVLGLMLIGIAIFTLSSATPFPGWAALLPVVGAVLIIAARHGVVNRLLSWRPIVFIGLVSYSWYLWHWPLLSFARIASGTGISRTVGAILAATSFGFAVLSYKFIEQPFRKSTTPNTLLFLRYGAVAALMMLVPTVFCVGHGLPQRYPADGRMEVGVRRYFTADKCLAGESVAHPMLKPPCVSPGGGRAVALIGDSHAAAVSDALRAIAARSGYRFIELDKEDCPALYGVTHFIPYAPSLADECTEFNLQRLNYILQHPAIRAVVLVGFWSKPLRHEKRGERYMADGGNGRAVSEAQSEQLFEQGLQELVQRLQRAGKTVYLVQDSPVFAFSPLEYMRTQLIGPRRVLARWFSHTALEYPGGIAPNPDLPADREARATLERIAAANPQVHLFDMQRTLCTPAGCRFAQGDQTFYVDPGHLYRLGARTALTGLTLP